IRAKDVPAICRKIGRRAPRMLGTLSVRPAPRPLAVTLLTALLGAGVPLALALVNCGPDAVGIAACRRIEAPRCGAAQQCGLTQEQTDACVNFYRDQCLVGIENDTMQPDEASVQACIDAVNATASCAGAKAKTMQGCAGAPLVATADASTLTPCDII